MPVTSRFFGTRSSVLGVFLIAAVMMTMAAPSAHAQGSRVGDTFYPKPADGFTIRFPNAAYDGANDAYLVTWTAFLSNGNHRVGARFVGPTGVLLGQPETVSLGFGGAAAAACGAEINACLIVWIQEPKTVMGRLVRYVNGAVTFLGDPFVVNANGAPKLSSAPPSVAYSSGAQEFLATWSEFGAGLDVHGQRVSANGVLAGGDIGIATSGLYEAFSSATYNSKSNEYFVGYYQEIAGGVNTVAGKRLQPGTGAILGGNTFWVSAFAQYPVVAYNSATNQYLAVAWGITNGWMLQGQLADANVNPIGTVLALGAGGGGDGVGITYNPVSNSYFAVYQSQFNAEMWGVTIGASGVPTTQFQVTVTGTKQTVQPRAAGSGRTRQFLAVGSSQYASIMGQMVQDGSGPPPVGVPAPFMGLDHPSTSASVSGAGFTISGWAVDLGAASGNGVDVLHVYAARTTGGQPIFVGQMPCTVNRGDIAQQYGQQFVTSGFSLTARLPPGTYDLVVFAHSSVASSFNNSRSVRITVTGSTSAATGDIDGDGRVDVTVYNQQTGIWYSLESHGGYVSAKNTSWGGPGYQPIAGDFDGDGRADRTVYNESSGDWFTLKSSAGFTTAMGRNVGGAGWTPAPGDFDGDGKTDYVVYNTSTGLWFGLLSGSGYTTSVSVPWGGAGYTAVPADYDGDGKADIAVYRASTGEWYVRTSSTGFAGTLYVRAGGAGYDPVPADFDGDGKADVMVYNNSTGLWFGLKSSASYGASISVAWGGADYDPVRGDFDGDGRADLAVYNRSTGGWYIRLSSTGYATTLGMSWGGAGYLPVGIIP